MLTPRVFPDHESVSRFAADRVSELLRDEPGALLCLATGKTPMRTYELLTQRRTGEPRLFEGVRVINLDEWLGLPHGDHATCGRQLGDAFVTPLGIGERYCGFESQPDDPAADCARVRNWLAEQGPIDLCVLGLGINGHIGFNEPADYLQPHAHVARLSDASLAHAMIGDCGSKPTGGSTLGMHDLMQSRRILLLVTGATKRDILQQILTDRITTAIPASLLHLHPNIELLCDVAALPAL